MTKPTRYQMQLATATLHKKATNRTMSRFEPMLSGSDRNLCATVLIRSSSPWRTVATLNGDSSSPEPVPKGDAGGDCTLFCSILTHLYAKSALRAFHVAIGGQRANKFIMQFLYMVPRKATDLPRPAARAHPPWLPSAAIRNSERGPVATYHGAIQCPEGGLSGKPERAAQASANLLMVQEQAFLVMHHVRGLLRSERERLPTAHDLPCRRRATLMDGNL